MKFPSTMGDMGYLEKPDERFSHADLRYRIADFVNDRLRTIPYVHNTLKRLANLIQYRRDLKQVHAAKETLFRSVRAVVTCPQNPHA